MASPKSQSKGNLFPPAEDLRQEVEERAREDGRRFGKQLLDTLEKGLSKTKEAKQN